MPVSVDEESVDAARLGLKTVGEVLAWAGRANRMVVRLLIDGEAPDLGRMDVVRQMGIGDRHVYVETVDPREAALDAVAQAERRLGDAKRIKDATIGLLRENQWTAAMEKLGGCMSGWLEAQQAAAAVAKMLAIPLEKLDAGGRTVAQVSADFAGQLRRIQTAIQDTDLIGLIDLLAYETGETTTSWNLALAGLKERIGALLPVKSAA